MQLTDLPHLFTVALNPQRQNQLQGVILFKNMQYYRVENWVVLLVMCVSDYHMLSSLKTAVMNNYHMLSSLKTAVMNNYHMLSSLKTAVMNNYHMLSSLKTAVMNNYHMLSSLKTAVMNNYHMLSSLKTAVQSKDGVLFFSFFWSAVRSRNAAHLSLWSVYEHPDRNGVASFWPTLSSKHLQWHAAMAPAPFIVVLLL